MAGTIVRVGRYRTGPNLDVAIVYESQQLAYVADKLNQTIIVYELGMWAGRYSGNPQTRIALARAAGSGSGSNRTPGQRIAYTDVKTPSSLYVDITGGESVVGTIDPVVLTPDNYAFAATSSAEAQLGLSMRQASAIAGENENFYRRDFLSSTVPTDPLGGTASNQGQLDIWGTGEANVAPDVPTGLVPTGTIPGTTLTPVIHSNFADDNEVLNNGTAFDRLTRVHVQVIRISDNAIMWDHEYGASEAESAVGAATKTYGGSALTYDVPYRYRVRHQDRCGSWSGWAETAFTLAGLGSVDVPTNPAGFETSSQPGPITAVYRHVQGKSTNAYQARFLSSTGAILKTTSAAAITVAPNGTLSMSWPTSGFGELDPGTVGGVSMRARDTDGNWSAWSPVSWFWTNATPYAPNQLQPAGAVAISYRPLLTCRALDPDPEQQESDLTVSARIKNAAGTVIATRAMSWNAAEGRFEYQTTSSDLASYATYRWDARVSDGYLNSAYSAEATFAYAAGPTVSITGPASTIETINPVVGIHTTFSGGATYASIQVNLARPLTGDVVWDRTVAASGTTDKSITISNDYWIGGEQWNNGETFNLFVSVTDSNGLSSFFGKPVKLEYTPPPTLLLDGAAIALAGTNGTNAVLLTGEPTSYDVGDFEGYEFARVELSGGADVPSSRVVLKRATNPASVTLLDAEITSGVLYRWEYAQLIRQGNDVLRSVAGSWTGSVRWDGVIMHMPFDPEGHHVGFRHGPPDESFESRLEHAQPHTMANPLGSGRRVVFFGRGQTHDPSGTFALITDPYSTADEKLEALRAIQFAQGGELDGRPHAACWRDGQGGRYGRIYGFLSRFGEVNHHGRYYLVDLEFTEAGFALGEALS